MRFPELQQYKKIDSSVVIFVVIEVKSCAFVLKCIGNLLEAVLYLVEDVVFFGIEMFKGGCRISVTQKERTRPASHMNVRDALQNRLPRRMQNFVARWPTSALPAREKYEKTGLFKQKGSMSLHLNA